jgi:hypothetical protein
VFAEPGQWVRRVPACLLPRGAFQPSFPMQCQHAHLPVHDNLPHFDGFAPLFGGSDDRVAR